MRDYRKRKREQGFCTYGGCWATTTKTYCTAHRDITNAKSYKYKRIRTKKIIKAPKICKFTDCMDLVKSPAIIYCLTHSNPTTYFVMRLRGQVTQGLCHQGTCIGIPVRGLTLCESHHDISVIKNRISMVKRREKLNDTRVLQMS